MSAARIQELDRTDEADLQTFRSLDPGGPMGPPRPPLDDARLLVARRDGAALARASIRTADDLANAPGRTGVIGHYEAAEAGAGVTLLREALTRLSGMGADRVIGPMDGTTWDRYRLALPTARTGDPAPFFTEPVNPPAYPAHFEQAGLRVVEWYVSQIVGDLEALAPRAEETAHILAEQGMRLEPLDPARFDDTLEELYRLSTAAFADNPYYSPIDLGRFRNLYAPMKPVLEPQLVLIARDEHDDAVGFVLAFPDLIDPAGRATRVVVKSLAVAPAARGIGLGSLLVHDVHERAARLGYGAAIHALMHVRNNSLKISSHGGRVFRNYGLYGWGG